MKMKAYFVIGSILFLLYALAFLFISNAITPFLGLPNLSEGGLLTGKFVGASLLACAFLFWQSNGKQISDVRNIIMATIVQQIIVIILLLHGLFIVSLLTHMAWIGLVIEIIFLVWGIMVLTVKE